MCAGDTSARFSVANTTEWGTDRRSALELIEDALNLRVPTVYDHDPATDRDVVDGPATEAARDKQEKLKAHFKQWIWQDDERRERLGRKYNDEFNHTRLRTFNGEHLTLPGANPAIVLRPHQKASVWRILQTPNCLLAQVVGKTNWMLLAAPLVTAALVIWAGVFAESPFSPLAWVKLIATREYGP